MIRSAAAAESSAGQQTPAMADVGAAMPTVLRDQPKPLKQGQPAVPPSGAPAALPLSPADLPQAQAPAAVTACTSGSGALINPKFETASGSQAAGWCDVFGRGYTRVRLTPAKYNFVAKLTIPTGLPHAQRLSAAQQTVLLNQTRADNLFIGAMLKGNSIVPDGAWMGAMLDVSFHVNCSAYPAFCQPPHSDGVVECQTLPSVGTFDWRWIGLDSHTCGVGYVDASGHWRDVPIKSVDVMVLLGYGTGTAWFDLVQLIQFPPRPAAVTFMFDDGNKSTVTQAKPILAKYGFVGSAAIVKNYVNGAGLLTAQDLRNLQNAGWDIASHGVNHDDMTKLSNAAAKADLINSKSYLQSLGLTVDTYAWPFGAHDQRVIGLAQPVYASTRTVESDDNARGTFPYTVKVLSLYNTTTLANVRAWVRDLKDNPNCVTNCNGRWGVFLAHNITPNPGTYDSTPAFLDALANEVKKSGIEVVNYRTGRQRFANVPRP